MRLIDADKLIPECMFRGRCDSGGGSRCDRCTDYAVQYQDIENALTVQPEQRWIPCSERLPEERGLYLTTTKNKEVYCDYWNEDNFDRTEMVIAWMPLPESYQEGGE